MKFLMKKENGFFLTLTVILYAVSVFAQDVPAVADPTWADGILKFIAENAMITTVFGFLVELALRLWPSQKALSILVPIKYACDSIVKILGWLSGLLGIAINAANNVKKV